jgi:SnoaL-like domain
MDSSTAKAVSAAPIPERLYQWFNSLHGRAEPVNEREIRSMWTEDCVMVTNGQVKCRGIPAFVKHFNEIREKLKSWEVELPLAIRVADQDRVAVYYRIALVAKDGSKNGVLVCAIFETRDGKAAKMTEVAHFEGAHLQLENH